MLAEDKLFATLDPTTRQYTLPSGMKLLLTDTVGFIRNLPHHLIKAFRSTLEEAALADVLLIVSDGASGEMLKQHDAVEQVLQELGATEQPRIEVINKCDLGAAVPALPGAVMVSAKTGEGIDELSARIALQVLGLDSRSTAVNCSLNEGCEKMTAKEIDAMHSFSGLETRSVAEITRSMDCVILRYTDEELEDILTYNPYYYKTVIPAGTYEDQTGDIPTFGVKCLLCVDEGMDEALVYALTAALWDSRGELSAAEPALADLMADEFVCQNLPIPLHEGAERFYQEMGAL